MLLTSEPSPPTIFIVSLFPCGNKILFAICYLHFLALIRVLTHSH